MNTHAYPWASMKAYTVVVAVALCGSLNRCSFAGVSEDEMLLARMVLAGHADNRQRLQAGSFDAVGTRQYMSKRHKLDTEVEVRVFCAFDYENSQLRFNRTEPPYNPDNDPNSFGGQFARTPTQVLILPPNGSKVTILGPEGSPLDGINPFDIRAIGSINLAEMETGFTFDRIFDLEDGFLRKDDLKDVSRLSETVVKILWEFPSSGAQRAIWFDLAKGYSPVRLEERARVRGGDGMSDPMNTAEVSWKQMADVWVPESVIVAEMLGVVPDATHLRQRRSYQLIFDWTQVNESLDAELFTYDGFMKNDREPVNRVIDARLNVPVLIKGTPPPSAKSRDIPLSEIKRGDSSFRVRIVLLSLNAIVILGICGFLILRRFRRRRT